MKQRIILSVIAIFSLIIECNAQGQQNRDYEKWLTDAVVYTQKGMDDKALALLEDIPTGYIEHADDTTRMLYHATYGQVMLFSSDTNLCVYHLDKAIKLYESLSIKSPQYISLLLYHGLAYDMLCKRDEAERWYRKALIKGKVIEHDADIDNNCCLNLGNIHNERGDYDMASNFYRNIAWTDSLQRIEPHAAYYGHMADKYLALSKEGRLEEADILNDSIINYTRTKFGNTDNYYLGALQSKGTIYFSQNRYSEAEKPFRETIRIGKSRNITNSYIGYAYIQLINLLSQQDKIDEACAIFPEAVDYLKKLNDHSATEYEACLYLGFGLIRNEKYEAGILALEKFLKNIPDNATWATAYAINKLTWGYLHTGMYDKAIEILSPLLHQDNRDLHNFSSVHPYLMKNLGLAYYFTGNMPAALTCMEQLSKLFPEFTENDTLVLELISNCKTNP